MTMHLRVVFGELGLDSNWDSASLRRQWSSLLTSKANSIFLNLLGTT